MGMQRLRDYVRLVLEAEENPRAPTQLLDPEDTGKEDTGKEDTDELDEFSAAGGAGNTVGGGNIMGHMGTPGPTVKKSRKSRKKR